MSKEPDIEVELEDTSSGHSQWLEFYISITKDRARVIKKNSMPVHDECKYMYSSEKGELSFVSGTKSCSGAGKSRSVSPSDKIDEIILETIENAKIEGVRS